MQTWKIYPKIRFGTFRDYFHEAEKIREKLPVVNEELNYFANGCYTTQSRIKRGNRRLEAAFYDAEAMSALAGQKVGFPYAKENIDRILTVQDDELIGAFLDMVENHKMIVENSGLLTVAALKQLDLKGQKGSSSLKRRNMDIITMSSVVQHGLIQRDRIFSVSVLLPDKPGELVRTAKTVADAQGNVIKLEHNQFVSTNRNAAVELRLTIEAFGTEHKHEIMQALEDEGLRPREIGAKLY